MNTQMMNSRQANEDRAEALEFAIEARSAELMTHGEACDPFCALNILEALDESTITEKMEISRLLAERKFGQFGILINSITQTYWSKLANQMAQQEFE
jgi:hypothetical protein